MEKRLSIKELIVFFAPMAAMAMIMKASHNIINYALGQTVDSATALSAYSVGMSLSMMIMAPIWVLSKATTAVAHSKNAAKKSLQVSMQAMIIVTLLMILIAFTPIGEFIFCNLMGVSSTLLPHVLSVFKVFILMPVFGAIRATHQSFIALRKKTIWLTIGTIVRIILMFLLTKVIISMNLVKGSYIGAIILVFGFGIEGLVWFIKGKHWLREAPEDEAEKEEVQIKGIWILLLPLVVAQLINGFVGTSISAGLLRTTNPEVATSAYFLSRTIAWIFLAVSFSASQMVLVFVKNNKDFLVVKKFVVALAALMVVLISIIAFTPMGNYVYLKLLNVDSLLAKEALKSLAVFALVPPAMFLVELYQGMLLKNRMSKKITFCKLLNIIVLTIVTFVLVTLFPNLGGMIGSLSFTIAFYMEALISYYMSKKYVLTKASTTSKISQAV